MRVGTLVNHEDYFGVGIVIDIRETQGKREWIIHWIIEGKNFGWVNADVDLRQSVEIICE